MKNQKSETVTLILSILCGLIGLMGMGYFYVRKKRKGLVFLLAGLTGIAIIGSFAITDQGRFSMVALPSTILAGEYNPIGSIVIFSILFYFALYFVQIYDSVKSCRKYNLKENDRFDLVNLEVYSTIMSKRDQIKLGVPLAILVLIGGFLGFQVFQEIQKYNLIQEAEQQAQQQEFEVNLLERMSPTYAENYQKWKACIQNTDGVYSHYSGMSDCGEDMLPPIYPSISQTQQTMQTQSTMQVQQTPQVTQTDKLQVTHQVQGTQLLQTSMKQGNSTSNPSGATAIISTNFGEIKFRLLDNVAPKTVGNFEKLSVSGFYDGTVFHRIIPGFVIQGGDPNTRNGTRDTWGVGNAGYTIPPEFSSSLKFTKYMVGMARGSDINSGSSQFFITLGDDSSLNDQYALFGEVISGQDVVDKIASIKTDPTTSQPLDPDEARIIKIIIHN